MAQVKRGAGGRAPPSRVHAHVRRCSSSDSPRSGGSATAVSLALLFLLAAVCAGMALVLGASLDGERGSRRRDEERLAMEKEGARIIAELGRDPSPEADSPDDPVWGAVARPRMPGAAVRLEDVSSAINLNWAPKSLFSQTALKGLLRPGRSAEELQGRREERGLGLDIASRYGDLLNEGAIQKYCTAYGYPNINIADELAVRAVCALRTGSETAGNDVRGRVQLLRLRKKILARSEVGGFLGADEALLFPLLNGEPVLNVHFLAPFTLEAIMAWPEMKVPHPDRAARTVLGMRETSAVTPASLAQIIGAPADSRILQYLGVVTWFWRITVETKTSGLALVVARLPVEAGERARFLVVEERCIR